jgi:hypothetical protein
MALLVFVAIYNADSVIKAARARPHLPVLALTFATGVGLSLIL